MNLPDIHHSLHHSNFNLQNANQLPPKNFKPLHQVHCQTFPKHQNDPFHRRSP